MVKKTQAISTPFGESIAFMLSLLGSLESGRFRELLSSHSLEPRSFSVLRVLMNHQSYSQRELSQELKIPESSLVAVIDNLEEANMLVRVVHPSDRRVHLLELTDIGRKKIAEATENAWRHEFELSSGLSEEERKILLEGLTKIAHNLGISWE